MTDQLAGAMRSAADRYPQLSDSGFGVFDDLRLTPEEDKAWIDSNRLKLFERRSLEQFDKARSWLRQWSKLKSINRRAGSSYGLKHIAEHDIGYLTNGVLIAAAIAEGFIIKRVGPNAWFNISQAARKED